MWQALAHSIHFTQIHLNQSINIYLSYINTQHKIICASGVIYCILHPRVQHQHWPFLAPEECGLAAVVPGITQISRGISHGLEQWSLASLLDIQRDFLLLASHLAMLCAAGSSCCSLEEVFLSSGMCLLVPAVESQLGVLDAALALLVVLPLPISLWHRCCSEEAPGHLSLD